MKQTLKTMAGALALGFLFGGGCTVGAVATGMLVPRGQSESRWAQAQVAEMQETLERIERDIVYDYIAANPRFDEMAGLE